MTMHKATVYCKGCDYYIPELGESKDICGYYLNKEKNALGEEVFVAFGLKDHCPSCGAILKDDTQLILRSCHQVNHDKRCKVFKKKSNWFFRLFKRDT